MAYSGVTLVSFLFVAVSFQLVPVYSGTILVHSVSFRRVRYIPVYSVPFHSVPVFNNAPYVQPRSQGFFFYTRLPHVGIKVPLSSLVDIKVRDSLN